MKLIGFQKVRIKSGVVDCQIETARSESFVMEMGLNSDVLFAGSEYHVQTEDWGAANPFIVTRVYCNGGIVKSVKSPYAEVVPGEMLRSSNIHGLAFRRALVSAIQTQHRTILDQLVSGQLL